MKKTIIILIGVLVIGILVSLVIIRVPEKVKEEPEEKIEKILIPEVEILFTIPEEHGEIFKLTFSADNQRFVYRESENGKYFVVLDGIEQERYDRVTSFTFNPAFIFSPDSQHLVYEAEEKGKEFFVLDGVEQKRYDGAHHLTFSPDSQHFAYIVEENGKEFIVLDGIEQKRYNIIARINFTPDSQYLIYNARDGQDILRIIKELNN